MRIAIGNDHVAVDMKNHIKKHLEEKGFEVINFGTDSTERCELVSCGIGVPGTVSDDGKRLIKAPNISIVSEDIADKISEALNLPTALVQDSRAAA